MHNLKKYIVTIYSLLSGCLKRKVVLSTSIKICDFCCLVCGVFGIHGSSLVCALFHLCEVMLFILQKCSFVLNLLFVHH